VSLLKGKPASETLLARIRERARAVTEERGNPPQLAVLAIGGDPSSQIYLKKKLQACKDAGIECILESLPASETQSETLRILRRLGEDPSVDGIIVELPLPEQLDENAITEGIAPGKDVEGVTRMNLGRLYCEKKYEGVERSDALIPCTAHAIVRLLLDSKIPVAGKRAVVIGRSNIVGKPAAHLLSCLDATVTLCHSKTEDLGAVVSEADIVVAAAGSPGLVKGAWIKKGAVVIDAGVNPVGRKIVGDVEFEAARERAGLITPVPGGVGPLTVTFLLYNTVLSAERRTKKTLEG
jgi:methylenetetrahydrofolate dehydrogenase (NADP+)/methenyltetrahydrofolate cyclohydrolase